MASPAWQSMPPNSVLTVSELLRSVRDALERRFPLLWVRGELSNLSRAPSGHCYFTLKDAAAQVDCVMFRSRAAALDWEPRDGARVEVCALVTLYEPRGRFQLTVEGMRPAGLGPLYERFLRLKEKLEREGLFDLAAKREPPAFPGCIGVLTSPAAAAPTGVRPRPRRRPSSSARRARSCSGGSPTACAAWDVKCAAASNTPCRTLTRWRAGWCTRGSACVPTSSS